MSIDLIDPPGLPRIPLYRQVSVATGSRLVHVAGQVGWDADGATMGTDLAAQLEQCYVNVATALEGAGGSWDDVVDLTVFVVDWRPERMPELVDGMERAFARLGKRFVPPAAMVGVAALDVPEHLVELKVVAVLD
ncbi:RidA family protein [Aeromicrobium sp. IC_218]|uniref:RidA family protein n=1 Tax=Aeromicrobium sp. IC_218 TaxID=2545468 RepID=UPI00103CF72D|nr:RidA family protein [Aeromicrobium sp. IC_218]TCI99672.1 RidA family protein [Aeromicrobium sp. IC_218]